MDSNTSDSLTHEQAVRLVKKYMETIGTNGASFPFYLSYWLEQDITGEMVSEMMKKPTDLLVDVIELITFNRWRLEDDRLVRDNY